MKTTFICMTNVNKKNSTIEEYITCLDAICYKRFCASFSCLGLDNDDLQNYYDMGFTVEQVCDDLVIRYDLIEL